MTSPGHRSRNAVPRNENVSSVCGCRICRGWLGEWLCQLDVRRRRTDGFALVDVVDATAAVLAVVVVISPPAPACPRDPSREGPGVERDPGGGGR